MFTLTINTDNFEDDNIHYTLELTEILQDLAVKVMDRGVEDGPETVMDSNGNTVGKVSYF
jgi:hypothetical protein